MGFAAALHRGKNGDGSGKGDDVIVMWIEHGLVGVGAGAWGLCKSKATPVGGYGFDLGFGLWSFWFG